MNDSVKATLDELLHELKHLFLRVEKKFLVEDVKQMAMMMGKKPQRQTCFTHDDVRRVTLS